MWSLMGALMNGIAQIMRRGWRWVVSLLAVLLLVLNVMTVVSVAAYEAVRSVVDTVLSVASYAIETPSWGRSVRDNQSLSAERDRIRTTLHATQIELDQFEHELGAERRLRAADRARLADLQRETADARQMLAQINERLERTGRAAREADRMASRMRAEAQTIVARLEGRAARVMGVNILAEPASAIPFLGTLTVGGILTYELYATCETLEDLADLEELIAGASDAAAPERPSGCVETMTEVLAAVVDRRSERTACIEARVRTNRLDPEECVNFPLEDWDVPSIEAGDREPPPLPELQPLPDLR